MNLFKRMYQSVAREIETMTKGTDLIQYNVMMGVISSAMIAVLELASFFAVSKDNIGFRSIFLGTVKNVVYFR